MTTCSFCGAASQTDHPPITWSLSVEHGRTKMYCEPCSREHLRAMESKLDSEWW